MSVHYQRPLSKGSVSPFVLTDCRVYVCTGTYLTLLRVFYLTPQYNTELLTRPDTCLLNETPKQKPWLSSHQPSHISYLNESSAMPSNNLQRQERCGCRRHRRHSSVSIVSAMGRLHKNKNNQWNIFSMFALLSIMLLLVVAGASSPLEIGLRSAVRSSFALTRLNISRVFDRRKSVQYVRKSSPGNDLVRLVIEEENNEEKAVEEAFVGTSLPQSVQYLGKSQVASRQKPRRQKSETEVDELESLAHLGHLTDTPVSEKSSSARKATNVATRLVTGRGGSAGAAASASLPFWENMLSGAISRSVAQTIMHPANTMKTILQNNNPPSMGQLLSPKNFRRLTVGAGANFVLSVPHGAINFAVLEFVREKLDVFVQQTPSLSNKKDRLGPGLDFMSSAISTIACSIVSTPQMMITDNIMAGNYGNMPQAIRGLAQERGIEGFYGGWWPGLVGKIPSYGLTWAFFQQLKLTRDRLNPGRPANNVENSIMGCIASGTTVTIMIPMDTIKTRLVTQAVGANGVAYKGIIDCGVRILREEGMKTFYRGLPPRLISVVPMIGIQFGVYEFIKKQLLQRKETVKMTGTTTKQQVYDSESVIEEAAMEVAASPEHPFPAPHFMKEGKKRE